MKFNFQCRTLACKGVVGNEESPLTSICAFLEENGFSGAVLDLWTTGCTRCPAKLDEINTMALANNVEGTNGGSLNETGVQLGVRGEVLIGRNIVFASVNLDDANKVRMMLNGGERWSGMTHFAVDEDVREDIKRTLDIQFVPHLVVLEAGGEILIHGSPKQVCLSLSRGTIFPPALPAETEDAGSMCVGGVCRLPPRRNKVVKLAPTPESSESLCIGGVCRLPSRPKIATTPLGDAEKENIAPMSPNSCFASQNKPPSGGNCPRGGKWDLKPLSSPCQLAAPLLVGDALPPLELEGLFLVNQRQNSIIRTSATANLEELRAGRMMVVDIWSPACKHWPTVLHSMTTKAESADLSQVVFVTINLGNVAEAVRLITEHDINPAHSRATVVHFHMNSKANISLLGSLSLEDASYRLIVGANGIITEMGEVGVTGTEFMDAIPEKTPPTQLKDSTQQKLKSIHIAPTSQLVPPVYTFSLSEEF
eukprot:25505_1